MIRAPVQRVWPAAMPGTWHEAERHGMVPGGDDEDARAGEWAMQSACP
jgi:hypothetical protein